MSQQQWGGPSPYGPAPTYGRPAAGYNPYQQPYGGSGFTSPGYGPGFSPGGVPQYGAPGRPPAPRRRSSPLKLLMLALMALAVVSIIGLVGVSSLTTPSDVAYQNDDYKVPPPETNPDPIPQPQTYEEAEQWITQNPFYDQTAPAPVRCTTQPINVATASDAQLDSHFEGMMECLVRVWQPPVTQAGWKVVRPSVTIYGSKMTTKCGTSGVNAFYCGADQQVYYSNQLADAVPIVREEKWAADVVIAHEFAHALQGRTGILISAKALGQQSNDQATDLLYTRRLETQADCLSGMFIRSVATSLGVQQQDVSGIQATYEAIGDDTLSGDPTVVGNHGLSRSRLFWGQTGLGNSGVGKCNTFIAPESQVR